MRQLLLRVPDELHRRLTERARREGTSVNAMANDILDAATAGEPDDPQARVRAKAAALGILRDRPARRVSEEERQRVLDAFRGIGPVLDEILDDERNIL